MLQCFVLLAVLFTFNSLATDSKITNKAFNDVIICLFCYTNTSLSYFYVQCYKKASDCQPIITNGAFILLLRLFNSFPGGNA